MIARNSTFTYKARAVTVQQVGRELGVRGVLDGSVFKAANRVRITVRLADASTGANVWAARFDQPLSDIFALQDEIVRKIVTTLKLMYKLKSLELPPVRLQPTNNLDAFDCFLRAIVFGNETRAGLERTQAMFEKAIALDPNYADAYALLASNLLFAVKYQYNHDPKTWDRVVELAQRAIALDDSNPWGYMVLGQVDGFKHNYDLAIAEERRAITLDPSYSMAYFWLGDVLNYAGNPAESIRVD